MTLGRLVKLDRKNSPELAKYAIDRDLIEIAKALLNRRQICFEGAFFNIVAWCYLLWIRGGNNLSLADLAMLISTMLLICIGITSPRYGRKGAMVVQLLRSLSIIEEAIGHDIGTGRADLEETAAVQKLMHDRALNILAHEAGEGIVLWTKKKSKKKRAEWRKDLQSLSYRLPTLRGPEKSAEYSGYNEVTVLVTK